MWVCAGAAVVKVAACGCGRCPRLKIGGGVKREERHERAKWCQVRIALHSGKHELHYSVARAFCRGSLKGFSNLLSFALH